MCEDVQLRCENPASPGSQVDSGSGEIQPNHALFKSRKNQHLAQIGTLDRPLRKSLQQESLAATETCTLGQIYFRAEPLHGDIPSTPITPSYHPINEKYWTALCSRENLATFPRELSMPGYGLRRNATVEEG